MADEEKREAGVRITNQFRSRSAMVYDLSCAGLRISIQIAPRSNDDGLGEWSAEAHARLGPERPTVSEPGRTKLDALRAVGRAWVTKSGTVGFPAVDWDAITRALDAVRAT